MRNVSEKFEFSVLSQSRRRGRLCVITNSLDFLTGSHWKTNKKIQIHYRNLNTYMKTKSYMRYHRYDQNNVKYIKRFELNDIVPTEIEPGFTQWIRGTGPHSPEALINVAEGLRRACLGVPKPPEQREKMRQAKLGVPKTQEHKDNMRKSWYRRRELAERYIVDEIQSSSTASSA